MIGIGVNCVHHPAGTEFPATDLATAGVRTSPEGLFAHLSAAMAGAPGTMGPRRGICRHPRRLALARGGIGKPIRVKSGDGELSGTFEGIDETGRLVLRLPMGQCGPWRRATCLSGRGK